MDFMFVKKLKILAFVTMFCSCIAAMAQEYEIPIAEDCFFKKAITEDGEKAVITIDGVPAFEIPTRSTSETAKVFLILRHFRKEALKVMGVKWFKAIILSSPSAESEQFPITTYYDSKNAFQFAPDELSFFKSKNGSMIESLIGVNVIGMSVDELFPIFGEGVRITTGSGFKYMHNLKDIQYGASDERVYFYTENDVVTEMSYEKEFSTNIASGLKSFWGYTPVSEGWCTKGECSYNNVKIRESIPNGAVVGKINVDDGADMAEVMVLKTATIGQRYNWVKIITKSGLSGWVYGKFVRPGIVGTSFEQCLNNSIEYCKWFAANPSNKPIFIDEFTGIDGVNYRRKIFNTCQIDYILDDNGGENFSSIEYYDVGSDFSDHFCGLGVGSSLEAAKNFSDDMKKADAVPFDNYQEFRHNSSLSWITVDQKHRISVETVDGIVTKIIIKVLYL